jgi:Fic family protein
MHYIELRKLYYQDKEQYQKEYEARFSSPDTIKLDFKIKSNQAFFTPNQDLANLIIQILRTDKKIYRLSRDLPPVAIDQFTKRCLIDEIVLTNKIEGVNSTRREIATVLEELSINSAQKRKGRKRFFGLVAKYLRLQMLDFAEINTCSDIRELYNEIVLPEVIDEDPRNAPDGEIFRKESASVKTSTQKEIHRGVYPESAIIQEMKKAISFLHDETIEKLYRITGFHYLLEYIHPFYDGNGRLGRFLVSSLLAQELSPLIAYRISYTITENINDYYAAFRVCNDPHNKGDITPFLLMMLSMIQVSITQLEEALQKRKILLNRYVQVLSKLPLGENRTGRVCSVLIQAALFSEHGISTKELQECMENSYSTIRKELDVIKSAGFLIKKKVGKENFYSLNLDKLD